MPVQHLSVLFHTIPFLFKKICQTSHCISVLCSFNTSSNKRMKMATFQAALVAKRLKAMTMNCIIPASGPSGDLHCVLSPFCLLLFSVMSVLVKAKKFDSDNKMCDKRMNEQDLKSDQAFKTNFQESMLRAHFGQKSSIEVQCSPQRSSIIYVEPVLCCYECFLCTKVAICSPLTVWSELCGCGFLTSLFGLLPPSCWLALSDLWQSGANGTEPGFVSVVLWLDRCRLIGLFTPLSVPLSHFLPLDEVSDRVRWPASDCRRSAPPTPTHSSSSPRFFPPEDPGRRLAREPTHLQTRPPDLA